MNRNNYLNHLIIQVELDFLQNKLVVNETGDSYSKSTDTIIT